ncbi:MAG TPA: hypothetical protein VGQ90_09360, partial [Stellaceae bacterium]|nr:hypothetical protein [Stellaceae bacterium]
MDFDEFFPWAVLVIAAFLLSLKAQLNTRRIRTQLVDMSEQFDRLDQRVGRLATRLDEIAPGADEAVAEAEQPVVPEPIEPPEPVSAPAPVEGVAEPPVAPEEPVAPQPAAAPGKGWEQILVEHWLVWLGGAAMALGGAFL